MTDEITPTLDRHVQEQLGDVLRERFDTECDRRLPRKLETLMAALGDDGHDRGSPTAGY